jgi:hypothetical protein
MFGIQDLLRFNQFLIEFGQWQQRGQHRMLDIVQTIIAACNAPCLGMPALRPWVGRIDADVDDFRDLQTPLAHDLEPSAVPGGIRDQVNSDRDPQRPGEVERFKILAQRDALSVEGEALFVDGLDANEHVGESKGLPETEHLLVPQQHIPARFEIVLFADSPAGDRLTDGHPLFALNEGDVIDNEDAGLPDAAQVINDGLRTADAIRAAIKGPGAAERAVPWAASSKFDGCARIEDTDEVRAPVTEQIPRRAMVVEVLKHSNRRSFASRRHGAWHESQRPAFSGKRLEQRSHDRFPFALQHTVDPAVGVLEQGLRNERGAMPSDEHPTCGQQLFGHLREIDDFRHIGQIVARKPHDLRPLFVQQAKVVALGFHL